MFKTVGSAPDPYLFDEVFFAFGNRVTSGKVASSPYPTPDTGVFIIAGQSNCSNYVNAYYNPTNAGAVDNLNIYDGGMYRASEPLLGCSNTGGNLFTRMADKLVTGGYYDRVILIPVGLGGTSAQQWDTLLYRRAISGGRRAAALGINVSAILWMQGESEYLTTQSEYTSMLTSIMGKVAASGVTAPWVIGKCTDVGGIPKPAIQAAQLAIVNNTTIFQGADTDALTGSTYRYDGTHLNAAGAEAAAELWKSAVISAMHL